MSAITTHPQPERTAVEVVATFGDSVIGVKHVIDPRGGRIRTMTRALLIGGAVALAGAACGFAYAASVAASDAAQKEALIAQGRPEWAFRPHLMPYGVDLAFSLCGSLGLAALVWGLSRRKDERRDPRVRIGTAGGVDFAAPASPATDFALIAPDASGDGFVLRLAGGLTAEGVAAASELPITPGLRTRVRCGTMTFHVAGVPAPARQPTPILAALDRRVMSYFAGSLLAHAAILLILRAIPPDSETVSTDLASEEETYTHATLIALEADKPKINDGTEGDATDASNTAGTAVSMNLPSGKVGAPDQNSANPARMKSEGVTRDQAIEQARRAGVLDLFDGQETAMLTGSDDLTRGWDDLTSPGALDGDGDGAPNGSWGKGRHGVGTGGELVVAGDYNTIPGGRPGGDNFNIGPTGGHCAVGHVCRGHDPVPPPVKIGPPTGDIDIASVVQRYIKRYRDRIGYCYERELLAKPDLAGTVNVSFLLNADGAVLNANADGVDPAVSSCIGEVVRNIKFPRLADSGTFQIKYPFILHAPGH